MALVFIKPNDILAPYIERYWVFDNSDSTASFVSQIPPGVGTDLFMHYNEPFMLDSGEKLPLSHIIFSGQNSSHVSCIGNVHFIAIRFRAGALKNFIGIPLHQLLDIYPSAESIWGTPGKDFITRIKSIGEMDVAIDQLELFLEKRLDEHKKSSGAWGLIVQELYRQYDALTIDAASKKMNVSNRHFRRKFIEETGFSPKHFQQLARFHATIKPLLLYKQKTYLSTALGTGYFDQTHFIKEFKYFMDCTPSAFFQDKNFMSHFYYPSLNSQGNFVKK